MKPLADRLADRVRRKADAEAAGILPPLSVANPSLHEKARAEAVAKIGYDPHALAGIGHYDPDAVKVPN